MNNPIQRSGSFQWLAFVGLVITVAFLFILCNWKMSLKRKGAAPEQDFITVSTATVGEAIPDDGESDAGKEGRRILHKAQEVCAGFESFQCQIELKDATRFPGDVLYQSYVSTFACNAKGAYRFESTDSNGDKILFGSDGSVQWELSHAGRGLQRHEDRSTADEFGVWQGVTLGASIMLPSCLLQIEWSRQNLSLPQGRLLEAMATKARLDDEVEVDGHVCYVVICERPIGTWTFFVDKEEYILRRVVDSATPTQMSIQRAHGGGGFSGEILSTRTEQSFTSIITDVELPPSLFEAPPTYTQ